MSQQRTFTATNNGLYPVNLVTADISPANPAFSVVPQFALPHVLLPGQVMDFDVTASSTVLGPESSTLVIDHDGSGAPFTAPLSANFTPAQLAPDEVSGLQAWWDASQLVGLTNGQKVSLFPNLSGRVIDLTNPIASRYPTYITNVQNGLPCVRFNKANFECLFLDGGVGVSWSEQSVFLVAKVNTPTFTNGGGAGMSLLNSNMVNCGSFRANNGNDFFNLIDYGPFGQPGSFYKDGVLTPSANAGTLSPHIYEMTRVSAVTVSGGGFVYMAIANTANIGGAQSFDFYEGFFYNHILSASDRSGILQGLSVKWGIPLV